MALKRIRMKLTEEGVPLNALREIAILRRVDKYEHPNIVRFVHLYFVSIVFILSVLPLTACH